MNFDFLLLYVNVMYFPVFFFFLKTTILFYESANNSFLVLLQYFVFGFKHYIFTFIAIWVIVFKISYWKVPCCADVCITINK